MFWSFFACYLLIDSVRAFGISLDKNACWPILLNRQQWNNFLAILQSFLEHIFTIFICYNL